MSVAPNAMDLSEPTSASRTHEMLLSTEVLIDCQDSDDCQPASPQPGAKPPRAKMNPEDRTDNHLSAIMQAMGYRRVKGSSRSVSTRVRWLVQHTGLLCEHLSEAGMTAGFSQDLNVLHCGLQELSEQVDVRRRAYAEDWKDALKSLITPEGDAFLRTASLAAGFYANPPGQVPTFGTMEEAMQEIARLRRVIKRKNKEARRFTIEDTDACSPSAGPDMHDAENLLSLAESPAASRTREEVVNLADCQALVVHDFQLASPAAPAATPAAPAVPTPWHARARVTLVPPRWGMIGDLHEKCDKLPRVAQERLAYALFANQELSVALQGLVTDVPLSNGRGRLPMAAKTNLITAVVMLNPPPPPGMTVRLKMTLHDATNGEQVSRAVLKGNPAFENVGHGDSDSVYDAVGETGMCKIKARLGFTGQLTTYHDTEAPFFLRVEVVDSTVPAVGDSAHFMVHARKKCDDEMANREACFGGAHPREEGEGDEPPPPAKRQAKAPAKAPAKAAAKAASKAAAPKAKAPPKAKTVLDNVPKRRPMGGVPAPLRRMELLPRAKMPVRAPDPAPPTLGDEVDEAIAAIERMDAENAAEVAAQDAQDAQERLGEPVVAAAP